MADLDLTRILRDIVLPIHLIRSLLPIPSNDSHKSPALVAAVDRESAGPGPSPGQRESLGHGGAQLGLVDVGGAVGNRDDLDNGRVDGFLGRVGRELDTVVDDLPVEHGRHGFHGGGVCGAGVEGVAGLGGVPAWNNSTLLAS